MRRLIRRRRYQLEAYQRCWPRGNDRRRRRRRLRSASAQYQERSQRRNAALVGFASDHHRREVNAIGENADFSRFPVKRRRVWSFPPTLPYGFPYAEIPPTEQTTRDALSPFYFEEVRPMNYGLAETLPSDHPTVPQIDNSRPQSVLVDFAGRRRIRTPQAVPYFAQIPESG